MHIGEETQILNDKQLTFLYTYSITQFYLPCIHSLAQLAFFAWNIFLYSCLVNPSSFFMAYINNPFVIF